MTELFKSITTSQYIAALTTLEQSIDRCDDDTWAAEHIDGTVSQVVNHTLFYTDLYRGLASRYPEFKYDITLSSPNPETWAGGRGRVTDLIEKRVQPADVETTEAYLCGGRDMIEECKARLMAKGFPETAIHNENFY